MGYGVDFGGLTDGLVGSEAALAVDEVRGEDCVDKSALAESSLACVIISLSAWSFICICFAEGVREVYQSDFVQALRVMCKTYQRK